MELRDLLVTPLIILLVLVAAYWVRPRVTDDITRRYFFPGLLVKIFGAIALGFIYQFYYNGGDTYNFHTHGSRHIWEAFMDDPLIGFNLLTSNGNYFPGSYTYVSRMLFYTDPSSFFVIRIAAFFDLCTFSSYSATAVLFSALAFSGSWCLFLTFYDQSPSLHFSTAVATLFIPSVVIWGSGLLKDTITLACIGFLTYATYKLLVQKKIQIGTIILGMVSIWVLFVVKKYILLCFLPAVLLWIYAANIARFRSIVIKILLVPILITIMGASGYFAVVFIGADDPRYALDKIAVTAKITAYDIGFYSGRDAGSGYSLGELDGTFTNLLSKFPQAVNVSLFRPYLWEVRNPLMLLAAVESFALLGFTFYVFVTAGIRIFSIASQPNVIFGLVFSITFAFAVGVSTYNFGTLTRYKIPLLPFYLLSLIFIRHYLKRDKNVASLDVTE